MFYTYVLKSLSSDHHYIGQTDNLKKRLDYHNHGRVRWTSNYVPWKIIYFEEFPTRELSLQREKYLKSHAGRNWLKMKIK